MGQHDDERMDRITQMLEEGVENVFTSENYANWLRTMSRFHTYSWRNQLLISMQTAGTATQVAGYSTWKSLGRQVRKGEKGIWILAPVTIKVPKTPERVVQDDLGNEHDEDRLRVVAFKPAVVFDVSQTEGKELPSIAHELTADDPAYDEIINKLIAFSSVPVEFTSDLEPDVYGRYSPSGNLIKVRDTLSRSHKVKTLVHEICHSMWECDPEHRDDRLTAEVRAESTAFCVCSALSIPTDDFSFGYIASWSTGKDAPELKATMQDIRDTADKILTAIMPKETVKEAADIRTGIAGSDIQSARKAQRLRKKAEKPAAGIRQ